MSNEAVIRIRVDSNGATQAMDGLARSTKKTEDATKSYARAAKEAESASRAQQRAIEQNSRAFESAGKAALGFGLGMAGINSAQQVLQSTFRATIGQFAQYEKQLNIMEATSGATAAEMAKVSAHAKALGNDLNLPGVSASQAASAMLELNKAGLSVNDTMGAARGVLQLAIAGQTDTATAAKIAAGALNAFGLAGTEATRVADLLAAAANASQADITDLGLGMAQASAVFKNANQPIETLITAMGLMSNAGIQGSDAATSLKTAMIALQAPTDKAAGVMKDLGINVRDQQGNMLPLRDIIAELTAKLGVLGQAEQDAALKTIFGTDAIRAAQIVLTAGTGSYDQMAAAVTRAGAAQELAAAQAKGVSGAWSGLQSQMETIALDIGEKAAPAVEGLINKLAELVKYGETNIRIAVEFAMKDIPGTDTSFFDRLRDAIGREWDAPSHPFTAWLKMIVEVQEALKILGDEHTKTADTATEETQRITEGWRGSAEQMQKFGLDTLAAAHGLDTAASSASAFQTPLLDAARDAMSLKQNVEEVAPAATQSFESAEQATYAFQSTLEETEGDIKKVRKALDELWQSPTGPETVFNREIQAFNGILAHTEAALYSTGEQLDMYKDRAREAARATGLQGDNLETVLGLIDQLGQSKEQDAAIQERLNGIIEDGTDILGAFANSEKSARELAGSLAQEMLGLGGTISSLKTTMNDFVIAFLGGLQQMSANAVIQAQAINRALAGAIPPAASMQIAGQVQDILVGKGIPGYADGGFVADTGLALVHKGEYVVPADVAAQINGGNMDLNRVLRATNPTLGGASTSTASRSSASAGTAVTTAAAAPSAPNPWAGMWSGDFDVSGLTAGSSTRQFLIDIRQIELETQRLKLVLSNTDPYSAQASAIQEQINILDKWRDKLQGQINYVRLLKDALEDSKTALDHFNETLPRVQQAASDEKIFGSRGASLLAGIRGFDPDDPKSMIRLTEIAQSYLEGLGEIGERGAAEFWARFAEFAASPGPEAANGIMQGMAQLERQLSESRALTGENVRAATDAALVKARRSGTGTVLTAADPNDPRALERVAEQSARAIAHIEDTFNPARAQQLIDAYWLAFETRSDQGFINLDRAMQILAIDMDELPKAVRGTLEATADELLAGTARMELSTRQLGKLLSAIPDDMDKWPVAAAGAKNSILEVFELVRRGSITYEEAIDRIARANEFAQKAIQETAEETRRLLNEIESFRQAYQKVGSNMPGDQALALANLTDGSTGNSADSDKGWPFSTPSLGQQLNWPNNNPHWSTSDVAKVLGHRITNPWQVMGLFHSTPITRAARAMATGGVIDQPVAGIDASGQRYLIGEAGREIVLPVADFKRALMATGMGLPPPLPASVASVLGSVTDAFGGQAMPGSTNWWQMVLGGAGRLGPGGDGAAASELRGGAHNAWDLMLSGHLGRERATPTAPYYIPRRGPEPRGTAPTINIYTRERSTARELYRTASRAANRFTS